MAIQDINVGAAPNDKTGDSLRDAFIKTKENFAYLDGLRGAPGGVAPLGVDSKIPAAYLPGSVDDVVEYNSLGDFPTTGESGKLYVALDTEKIYRWGGSVYVEISPSPGSTDAVPEGEINKYYTWARTRADMAANAQDARSALGVLGRTDAVQQFAPGVSLPMQDQGPIATTSQGLMVWNGVAYVPKHAPIYQAGAIPATNVGPIYVEGVGPMEWSLSLGFYIPKRVQNVRIFDANASITAPARYLLIQGCGGGGGGGGGAGFVALTSQCHGAGGGSGAFGLWYPLQVPAGAVLRVVIGAGGGLGPGGGPGIAGEQGGAGGPTILYANDVEIYRYPGGVGGVGGTLGGPAFGGAGGTGGGYPGVIGGQRGQDGMYADTQGSSGMCLRSGDGGGTPFGPGGRGKSALSVGTTADPATGYGAGGGGGCAPISASTGEAARGGNGAVGRPGILMLAW